MEVWDEKSKTFETSIVNDAGSSGNDRNGYGRSLSDL